MKKIISTVIVIICVPLFGYGQNSATIRVIETRESSTPLTDIVNRQIEAARLAEKEEYAREEARRAREETKRATNAAAKREELKNTYSDIKVDFLKNNSEKYTSVIITDVRGPGNADALKEIWDLLAISKNVYSSITWADTKANDLNYYKDPPTDIKYGEGTLELYWTIGLVNAYSKLYTLTLKNWMGKVIFEAQYKNLAYAEMLYPIYSDNYSDNYLIIKK